MAKNPELPSLSPLEALAAFETNDVSVEDTLRFQFWAGWPNEVTPQTLESIFTDLSGDRATAYSFQVLAHWYQTKNDLDAALDCRLHALSRCPRWDPLDSARLLANIGEMLAHRREPAAEIFARRALAVDPVQALALRVLKESAARTFVASSGVRWSDEERARQVVFADYDGVMADHFGQPRRSALVAAHLGSPGYAWAPLAMTQRMRWALYQSNLFSFMGLCRSEAQERSHNEALLEIFLRDPAAIEAQKLSRRRTGDNPFHLASFNVRFAACEAAAKRGDPAAVYPFLLDFERPVRMRAVLDLCVKFRDPLGLRILELETEMEELYQDQGRTVLRGLMPSDIRAALREG
jgi:hypothetical protein